MEKGQAADKAKEEYRSQLDKTNNKQTLHYTSEMPAVFNVSTINDNNHTFVVHIVYFCPL